MSARYSIGRGALALFVGLALATFVFAAPVHAAQAWWSVRSSSAPTMLQPGAARDEVQEIRISGTGDEHGTKPYLVTFVGQLSDRHLRPLRVRSNFSSEEPVVKTEGRADGR